MRSMIACLMICVALTTCESTPTYESYEGKTYQTTTLVHVYFDADQIRRNHEVMGEVVCEDEDAVTFADHERDMATQAMFHGANAIIVHGLDVIDITGLNRDQMLVGNPHYYQTMDELVHRRGEHPYWTTTVFLEAEPDTPLSATLIRYK